jgi:hypothetical protein
LSATENFPGNGGFTAALLLSIRTTDELYWC